MCRSALRLEDPRTCGRCRRPSSRLAPARATGPAAMPAGAFCLRTGAWARPDRCNMQRLDSLWRAGGLQVGALLARGPHGPMLAVLGTGGAPTAGRRVKCCGGQYKAVGSSSQSVCAAFFLQPAFGARARGHGRRRPDKSVLPLRPLRAERGDACAPGGMASHRCSSPV
jgi:hypothetical protein